MARPKGPSPCSLIGLRAKANAKPLVLCLPIEWTKREQERTERTEAKSSVCSVFSCYYGFRVRRQHGSHIIMRRDNPFAQTVVPAHRELDRGTLRAILRQTDIGVEDFIRLL